MFPCLIRQEKDKDYGAAQLKPPVPVNDQAVLEKEKVSSVRNKQGCYLRDIKYLYHLYRYISLS
jgi:hypothetical protein